MPSFPAISCGLIWSPAQVPLCNGVANAFVIFLKCSQPGSRDSLVLKTTAVSALHGSTELLQHRDLQPLFCYFSVFSGLTIWGQAADHNLWHAGPVSRSTFCCNRANSRGASQLRHARLGQQRGCSHACSRHIPGWRVLAGPHMLLGTSYPSLCHALPPRSELGTINQPLEKAMMHTLFSPVRCSMQHVRMNSEWIADAVHPARLPPKTRSILTGRIRKQHMHEVPSIQGAQSSL